jgi:putative transposase
MASERRALVEREEPELPLTVQAELLGVSRSSLYYQPRMPSAEEVAIKHRIDEIYTECPFFGSRRIAIELRQAGMTVNRKAVQRHMREMGIAGVCPGPNLSKRNQAHAIYPYLLRNVTASYPNHIWGIDITYIRMPHSWMYLVAILDWYSRYVVSWQLDDSLEIDFVLTAVDQALARSQPTIMNSDQGSHFTSPQYTQRLLDANVQISMDGKGRALDNVFTERLWRSVKYEEVYLHDYLVYWSPKTRPHVKIPKTSHVEGIKMTKRREFTAKFKFQVALEALPIVQQTQGTFLFRLLLT